MATITPITCLAKTGKDQKAAWAKARIEGTMTESEEDVIKLLSYEHLTGLEGTETGGQIANFFHEACQKSADLIASKVKVDSRREKYVEVFSVLDDALTNAKSGHPACIFGKGLLAQATRNLSGLKFSKADKVVTADDDGEVETETL